MKLEVREALQAARDLIANGWCQNRFSCMDLPVGDYRELPYMSVFVRHVAPGNVRQKCYCVMGALRAVTAERWDREDDEEQPLFCAAYEELQALRPSAYLDLWNDDPDRTHEEVLALFDAAIGGDDET